MHEPYKKIIYIYTQTLHRAYTYHTKNAKLMLKKRKPYKHNAQIKKNENLHKNHTNNNIKTMQNAKTLQNKTKKDVRNHPCTHMQKPF